MSLPALAIVIGIDYTGGGGDESSSPRFHIPRHNFSSDWSGSGEYSCRRNLPCQLNLAGSRGYKVSSVKAGFTAVDGQHPNVSSHTAGNKNIYTVVVYRKPIWP